MNNFSTGPFNVCLNPNSNSIAITIVAGFARIINGSPDSKEMLDYIFKALDKIKSNLLGRSFNNQVVPYIQQELNVLCNYLQAVYPLYSVATNRLQQTIQGDHL